MDRIGAGTFHKTLRTADRNFLFFVGFIGYPLRRWLVLVGEATRIAGARGIRDEKIALTVELEDHIGGERRDAKIPVMVKRDSLRDDRGVGQIRWQYRL